SAFLRTQTTRSWIVRFRRPYGQTKRPNPAFGGFLLSKRLEIIPLHSLFGPPDSISRNHVERTNQDVFSLTIGVPASYIGMDSRHDYFAKIIGETSVAIS